MIPKSTTIMFILCNLFFAAAHAEDIILADFEGQDFGAWTYTGNCFGTGPVHGPLGDQQPVKGFEGKGFLNTYHGNDGLFSLSTCMIPNDSDKTIELFSTGNPAKIKNLSIRKLKSAWN